MDIGTKLEAAQRRAREQAAALDAPTAEAPDAATPALAAPVSGSEQTAADAVAAMGGRQAGPTNPDAILAVVREDIAAGRAGQGADLVDDLAFGSGTRGGPGGVATSADDPVQSIGEMGIGAVASDGGPWYRDLKIDEFSTQIEQSLTPEAAADAARSVQIDASLTDEFAKQEIAEYDFEMEMRADEAARIEAEVQFQAEVAKGSAPSPGTPAEDHFVPDQVRGVGEALRGRLAPRGGGGDGHTDPADDASTVVRAGALPDHRDTLLGGDTRGAEDFGGGSKGLPDRHGGAIDPNEDQDLGGGSGPEIDPLAGPAVGPSGIGGGDEDGGFVLLEPTLGDVTPIEVDLPFSGTDDTSPGDDED
jgi:hypothetical protein